MRVAVVVCEDSPKWADLGDVWRDKLLRGQGEGGTQADEVHVFDATKGSLPRKEMLFRAGADGGFDGMVLTGSRWSANDEDKPWIESLAELVRFVALERVEDEAKIERPRIVASCFGCQLVAKALGGAVDKNTSGKFVFRAETVSPAAALQLFSWAPTELRPMKLFESHGEFVAELPLGAVHLASSPSCPNEMFFVPPLANGSETSQGGILAFQSHPEFDLEHMLDRLLPSLESKGLIDGAGAAEALASFDASPDSDELLLVIRRFLRFEDGPVNTPTTDTVMDLRKTFERELARIASQYEAEIARIQGGLPGPASRSKQDKAEARLFTSHDKEWQARAEAVLRGDATLPEVSTRTWEPGAGDRAAVAPGAVLLGKGKDSTTCTTLAGVHVSNVLGAQFGSVKLPDGTLKTLTVSGGADKKVVLCDPSAKEPSSTNHPLSSVVLEAPVIRIAVRPKDERCTTIVAGMDGKVHLLAVDPSSNLQLKQCEVPGIKQHSKLCTAGAWSPCGMWFATASRDNSVNIYQTTEGPSGIAEASLVSSLVCGDCPDALDFVHCFGALCLIIGVRNDFNLQYVVLHHLSEHEHSVAEGSVVKTNMNENGDDFVSFSVLDVAAAPGDLALVAVATDRSRIIIFRAGSAHQHRNLYGHNCSEYARSRISWHPSGQFLASNSESDLSIFVWDVVTGQAVFKLEGHKLSVRDVSFCGTGVLDPSMRGCLVSTSFDRTIKVWKQLAENDE
ncbi:Putative glutamine amidotransferase YLR126C [Durusdinium trenchii]|uniref:Glutamine amidotransferase YLR126C n=1 Tax=Durusdinium trenchii TaxID=1381693 RepID=A0ABP0JDX2_9DINO